MLRLLCFLVAGILLLPSATLGGEEHAPTRYGAGVNYGIAYDPGCGIDFVQVTGFALFDYDAVWPNRAPAPLRFKVEGNLGVTSAPRTRAIVSINMMALSFLDNLRTGHFRPYGEAGIGLIYTDFRVPGQGLRFNFNPQAGIGTEIDAGSGPPWFAAFRLHHLSNGGLHKDNRGINSVVFQIGRFF
jgi:hypothetical protein